MGVATAMAIKAISNVPANTGMAPKAPPAVTWPSRIGDLRLPVQSEEELERR